MKKNFTSDKNPGSYSFTITNIKHPSYTNADGTPIEYIKIYTINYGTNTILDELTALSITNLDAGSYFYIKFN